MSLRRTRTLTPEGEVHGVEFGDPARPLDALFLHATGFNAMTYQSLLAPLGMRARVMALDLRGHGRTTLPHVKPLRSWNQYRNDVIAWIDAQNLRNGILLAGHSMGAAVALMVAGKRPDLVRGLVLADPVILPQKAYRASHLFPFLRSIMHARHPMARQARRRRDTFGSMEEARKAYSGRGAFETWREPFLDDYLHDGLDRVDGGDADAVDQMWKLLCEPAWEADTFAAQRNRPWQALKRIKKFGVPTSILVASRGSVMTEDTIERIHKVFPDAQIKQLAGTSHFLPMEAPYAVRDEISNYLSRLVEGFNAVDEGPVRRTLEA